MNRAERRKRTPSKPKQLDANKEATKAAQTLLDAAAVIVQATKGGVNPTHLEVIGLASIIMHDVYDELMKEMTKGQDEHKPEISSEETVAEEATESEK